MKVTDQTTELIAESGLTEGEIKAEWLKMMFAQAAENGDVEQNMVWHILSLSSELYPEEMLDRLKIHGWL